MSKRCWLILAYMAFGTAVRALAGVEAPDDGSDPVYRTCAEGCEKNAYNIRDISIQSCKALFGNDNLYAEKPLYLHWKQWKCKSDCRYYCMMQREKERESVGLGPAKYHGKWPVKRVSPFQVPVYTILSAVNVVVEFIGWLSFFLLVRDRRLSGPVGRRKHYDYSGLWHIYGFLSVNAWFWITLFHISDVGLIKRLNYSSIVALMGYSLILAILRTFKVKHEATRVMVSTPFLGFLATHIIALNICESVGRGNIIHGLNTKVCLVIGIAQVVLWAGWAFVIAHPSMLKIWAVSFGAAFLMFSRTYDFPPYYGYIDSHTLWHAIAIPCTYLWWSFVKDDAKTQTLAIMMKMK